MTSQDDSKVCPECGETIKGQALVCRFCGYDYRVGARPKATPANGMAIASMVLGIVWVYWIGSVLALIFGYMARKQMAESGDAQSGRGMATAGIVLGWIGVGTLILAVIAAIAASGSGSHYN